jgi:hypothetical protein
LREDEERKQLCIDKIHYYQTILTHTEALLPSEIETYNWWLEEWKKALKKYDLIEDMKYKDNLENVH